MKVDEGFAVAVAVAGGAVGCFEPRAPVMRASAAPLLVSPGLQMLSVQRGSMVAAGALDGFAAAYFVGLSMSLPIGTPEAELLRAEVRAAIATLKDRDQTIVTLHLFDRMTFAAIAARLDGDPSEVTVRRYYHAAMLRLAKRLVRQ